MLWQLLLCVETDNVAWYIHLAVSHSNMASVDGSAITQIYTNINQLNKHTITFKIYIQLKKVKFNKPNILNPS